MNDFISAGGLLGLTYRETSRIILHEVSILCRTICVITNWLLHVAMNTLMRMESKDPKRNLGVSNDFVPLTKELADGDDVATTTFSL